ncbi:MAG: Gfo/Idh/MocA family oxidoreductase, partial [Acidobacteria bacterium]|nr:Gfo/Idh/MocA family oxidoreductase [Acidobacteriota bacterium]
MKIVRIAVVGVGHLGRHHARILADVPGVELVAIADINAARGAEVAAQHHTRAVTDWRTLVAEVDAVTIAAPTEAHVEIAAGFLERGVHVLVEKPMAATTAGADKLIALSRSRDA